MFGNRAGAKRAFDFGCENFGGVGKRMLTLALRARWTFTGGTVATLLTTGYRLRRLQRQFSALHILDRHVANSIAIYQTTPCHKQMTPEASQQLAGGEER
jgi:hypothetical protein